MTEEERHVQREGSLVSVRKDSAEEKGRKTAT